MLLDLLGAFGRGPLANAQAQSSDDLLNVQYERVERFSTPSILTIHFAPATIHDGKVQLWMSNALLKPLGNQRIIPQPATSKVDSGGVVYTSAAGRVPGSSELVSEDPGNAVKIAMYTIVHAIVGGQ